MPASGRAGTAVISVPADSSDQLLSPLAGSLFLIVPVASALVMESVWDASSHSRFDSAVLLSVQLGDHFPPAHL